MENNSTDSADDTAMLETLSADEMRGMIPELRKRQFELERQLETVLIALRDAKTSEKNYRIFLENSYDIFFILDTEGYFVFASPAFEQHLGYPARDVIGKHYTLTINPEDVPLCVEYLKKSFDEMYATTSPPFRVRHCDGSWLWFEVSGMPFVDSSNAVMFTAAARNITESRKLQEQLIQSQKMEAVGQLAGGLAHDFNNVLSIINGYCCLMRMDVEDNSEFAEYVGKILEASNRAGALTHSMLAFSRTQILNPQIQNLNTIVSNVGTFIKRVIGDNLNFRTVAREAELKVNVDAGQIEQILINMATNARDAMPHGGELEIATNHIFVDSPFIAASGKAETGCYAVITVSDTGEGMPETVMAKIFEPFFTTKEVGKGTGLGLAMVYGIVKQHNGFVDVSSEPGKGTTFAVFLPILGHPAQYPEAEDVAADEVPTGGEMILIAEDDLNLLEYMNKMLTKFGYRVIVAADGEEAVDKFRDNADDISLIVMDLIMPRKSGKQASDEINLIKPSVRTLFISGFSPDIIRQQGELGKDSEFIAKPVQPATLLRKVRNLLDREP